MNRSIAFPLVATIVAVLAPGVRGAETVAVPKEWSGTAPVPAAVVQSTRLLRERFLADRKHSARPWGRRAGARVTLAMRGAR